MAYIFQVVSKLKQGTRGLRGLSVRAVNPKPLYPPKTCVIRGLSEDIVFPGHMFESITDHAARFPLVSNVPRERLIEVSPCRPIQIGDHWRKLLFSGLLHSVICKSQGECIYNAFDFSNIGVIKNLNIFGFRKFERLGGMVNNSHEEYRNFVEVLFSNLCLNPSALQQLQDLDRFLRLLQHWPDHFLLHHPIFLEDEEVADLYVDAHRLVRHEFPTRGQRRASDHILWYMEKCYPNENCIRDCEKSVLFHHLLGVHGDVHRAVSTKLCKSPPDGSAVVDMHRIAMAHSIERSLLENARSRSTGASILLDTYSRKELIRGVRYLFPLYPAALVESFEYEQLWYRLNMLRRLPIPSIYRYVSPINMVLAAC